MNKKILALVCGVSLLVVTPVFAAGGYPEADGIDIGPDAKPSINRYYFNTKDYSSSNFSVGVWIGGSSAEYFSKGAVGFTRPYQFNINEPYNSIGITYQIYNTTNSDVRASKTLYGNYQHPDFDLETDRQNFKAYLYNISGVPATANGVLSY